MDKKKSFIIVAVACSVILIVLLIRYFPQFTGAIRVPEHYPTIQKAINAAKSGDTIFVGSGIYVERIVVNKTITLTGENKINTIIDGNRSTGPVVFVSADKVKITGFTIRNSCYVCYGIYMQYSINSSIVGNIFIENNRGIFVTQCANIVVANNTVINDFGTGIYVGYSTNVTLRNNELVGNAYNLGVEAMALSQFTHDIDTSNTINGKPIYYLVNQSNVIVPADAGYVGVINCINVTVRNMVLSDNRHGVLFAYTKNSLVKNVTFSDNIAGIWLVNSHNNSIVNNTITYHRHFGIALSSHSSNNTVSNNLIIRNRSLIFNETTDGIRLEFYATANRIINNSITDNTNGIRVLLDSSANQIYHNNFVNNTLRDYGESLNYWDDGYPSGGNYWSNYIDVDLYSGPYQNVTGSDGIWDHPYVVDANNQDRYPFTKPFAQP